MKFLRSWLLPLAILSGTGLATIQATHAHDHRGHSLDALRSRAMAHYHGEDYAAFVDLMEDVARSSNAAVDRYNLACGYALSGQADRALAELAVLVEQGAGYDFLEDEDFRSLHGRAEFLQLVAHAAFYEQMDQELEPLRDLAMEQYRADRFGVFVRIMESVVRFSRDDVDLYNLACGYALNGQADEAIAALERLAAQGSDHGAAHDSDFDSIRHDPRFQAVLARLSG